MADNKQLEFSEVTRIIDRIVDTSLEDMMHQSMMPYSEYIILERALPRVEDGLKPVQRRILYTMHELGLTPDKPFKKSARIVGDCLGKYHPHGDSSVYNAMVRMAQDFNMSMQLVDGHGNYGSIDGDSAAAMRYTEARMNPLTTEMLKDIDKDTVKWGFNFDDSLKEPNVLPCKFPNILVNGANGIAIGLATDIPPHNLTEVIDGTIELIKNPRLNLETLMQYIPAPDFPTGGYVIVGESLKTAYETGRGRVLMRAKISIEKSGRNNEQLIITELPYQVNKAVLLSKIMDLKESKKAAFQSIQDVVDESDRLGMRAVIVLKKDADANELLKHLYKSTDLEKPYNLNMVAIAKGKPEQLGLIPMLKYYIEHQRNIIYKRSQFDLSKAKKREIILSALLIAVQNIDEVVSIIKQSSSTTTAKDTLRARFDLSDIQAQAIIEMRLGRLTSLETKKLIEEIEEVLVLIEELTEIVESRAKQLKIVISELKDIKKRFKTLRRSNIISEDFDIPPVSISEEPVNGSLRDGIVVVDKQGNIKLVKERSYQLADKKISEQDEYSLPVQNIRLEQGRTLYAFTDLGNCLKIDNDKLIERSYKEKAVDIKSICADCLNGEKIIKIFYMEELPDDKCLYFISKNGMIKKTKWSEYNVSKELYQAVVVKEDDRIIEVQEEKEYCTMLLVTKEGMCLNALLDSVPEQGRRSNGVKGIKLNDGDEVVFATQVDGEGEIVLINDMGQGKRVICAMIDMMQRYRKGINIMKLRGGKFGSKILHGSYVKMPFDLALFTYDNELVIINTEDIPIESRISSGKPLVNEKLIVSVAKQADNI